MPSNPKDVLHQIFPTSHRLLLERQIRRELPNVNGRILVLGAGHDPYNRLLPESSYICRTDISADYNIDIVADAHNLPFEDGSYDTIVAIEVFEHLHSPHQAAAEMLRVLSPEGHALVSIPFMFHIHGDPQDYNRLTKNGINLLFGDFSKVQVEGFGTRWHVISDIVSTAFRGAAVLRIFNFIFALPLFGQCSNDCPSGYWVRLTK